MKRYRPGAAQNSDFCHICDTCEKDDGRQLLVWEPLPGRRGHFALCLECLARLNSEYNQSVELRIAVSRLVIPERVRNEIFERDHYHCVICGNVDDLQIDHIIPFSRGGKTEKGNLRTLCKTCNLKKGNRDG